MKLDLGRLLRTLRWLRARQVIHRALFRLPVAHPPAGSAPTRRPLTRMWVSPARRPPTMTGQSRLRFLAEEHDLQAVGWDNSRLPLLWRYNLHYFDDLNAYDPAARNAWHVDLVQRWIDDNPIGRGTAWAPYPTSLRIVNWIKWFLGGQEPHAHWLDSLALQARWLVKRLERHLLGNHLFVNAKALVFAGCYFEGPEADKWRALGIRILRDEVPEQVLPDGGQFERSPMYHLLALEDVLDVLNMTQAVKLSDPASAEVAVQLRSILPSMLDWAACMRHPDGSLVRFNDTADGIAPPLGELQRYARALAVVTPESPSAAVRILQPSGYVRVDWGAATGFFDVAPIGPDYLPGHAHADTLCFELSIHGRRIVVNRGTSVYGDGPRRQLERGTAAHNTVQIASVDSSEVWAGFRVGRRARPGSVTLTESSLIASHDGYRSLSGRPLHHRAWHWRTGELQIEDRLIPGTTLTAVARFHLAPGLSIAKREGSVWAVLHDGAEIARVRVDQGEPYVEPWMHAVAFGEVAAASTLAVRLVEQRALVTISWND